ncbi:hypothetical protein [Anaerolentibacter hominis]|uniref:hypothetical protein n=1 Tax=Anaerolentibacter hominis TaxID=3079009 RepID=UPI0031B80739
MKNRKKRMWTISAGIILLAAAACILTFQWKKPEKKELGYEQNVVVGNIPGKTEAERLAELEEIVDRGMLTLSINATPALSLSGGSMANWLIENPSNQGKLIRVEVSLEDTGEIIYQTGFIKPGSYVAEAPMDVKLGVGQYTCLATFYGYDLENEELIGQAAAEIKLTVQE